MTKNIGIWIDKRVAKLVSITNNMEEVHTIQSSVDEFHPKGGSGSRVKGGPQDVVQDSKFLEKEKHQFKQFFADISEYIKDAESLVIFGPAQTGQKLHKELSILNLELSKKVSGVEKADSMTDNEIKAWVRKYFSV